MADRNEPNVSRAPDSGHPWSRGPFQFGLGFLFYATTVLAFVFLIFRAFSWEMANLPLFRYAFGGYLLVVAIYVVFRVPLLLRRYLSGRHAVAAGRAALAASIDRAGDKTQSETEGEA